MRTIKLVVLTTIVVTAVAALNSRAKRECPELEGCTIYPESVVVDGDAYIHGSLLVGGSNEVWIRDEGIDTPEITSADGQFGYLYASSKYFKIDHPKDPANKYLYHSSVESPDMKNIYDGIVTLDELGSAVVTLPAWFSDLNGGFRYQLTPVGKSAAGLYIADEIANNRFRIAGGSSALKVSWQVTGIRHDRAALNHPQAVEEDKAPADRGRYIDPMAFGQPAKAGILSAPRPAVSARPTGNKH